MRSSSLRLIISIVLSSGMAQSTIGLAQTSALPTEIVQEIEILQKQGKPDVALEKLDKIISQDGKNVQARFAKGLVLAESNRVNEAISVFQKISEDHPEMPEPYNNLAVLYAQQKNYEKSRIALEMAIRTHPSYAVAYENLGDIYAKLASQSYDKAFKLDGSKNELPNRMALLRNIGNIGNRKPPNVTNTQLAMNAPSKINTNNVVLNAPVKSNEVSISSKTETNKSKEIVKPETKSNEREKGEQNKENIKNITKANLPKVEIAKVSAKEENKQDKSDKTDKLAKNEEKVKVDEKEQQKKLIAKAITSWSNAWASKNANAYFSHYLNSFQPSGMSNSQWQSERRERLNKPGKIEVISGVAKIVFDKNTATASFPLTYRSQTLNTHASKTLVFTQVNGKWLISKESGR